MLTSRCRQLRPLLTSYVDNETSSADRLIVEDHLKRCRACRHRLGRQDAVHHLLRLRSAEARVHGLPLSWSPRSRRVNDRGPGRTLLRLSVLAAAGVAVVVVVWSRWGVVPLSARGQISDSVCGGRHAHAAPELVNMTGRDCVRRCVEKGAQYIFVSDGVVYPIRNQTMAELARFAEQDVQLEGKVRQQQLTVSHIRPLNSVARSTRDISAIVAAEYETDDLEEQ
jgi:hypothetical protein